jgi:ABC-type sugar transport system substrate-binding protein
VIEDTIGSRRFFHIGPDDFQIGGLAAKLVNLYSGNKCNVIVLSPNATFTGTQQRISGFVSKIKQEPLDMNILQVCSVPGENEEETYKNIYSMTLDCIQNHSSLNAIYVTNGLTQWCADAVKDSGNTGRIKVFGHEYTSEIKDYLESGVVCATIYQKPAQQFYTAICMLYEILIGDRLKQESNVITECSILIKESLPFIKISGLDLL